MIHKNICNRRHQDYLKAKRKQEISLHVYGFEWYKAFGAYNKGKIHCSCPMCAEKTNTKQNKSNGPVDGKKGSRIPSTNHRNGKKNYTFSDTKKVKAMEDEMREYLSA